MICGAIISHNFVKPIFVGLTCFSPAAHIIYLSINVGVTMPAQVNYCQIFKVLKVDKLMICYISTIYKKETHKSTSLNLLK